MVAAQNRFDIGSGNIVVNGMDWGHTRQHDDNGTRTFPNGR